MKTILGSRRDHYVARVSIFLTVLALIAGMVGCAGDGNGGGGSCTLIVDFTAGGTVTLDDVPIPGNAILPYAAGTVVSVNASPSAGYRFVEWSGNATTIADTNAGSTTITVNDDYSIVANFVKQHDLTISSIAGGSVTTPGEGTYTYDEGKVINLVAQAEGGYHFVNWTGDVSTIANVNATITSITMSGSYIITANFAVDLYFEADVNVILDGPVTLPPEQRNPCFALQVFTNIITNSVQVDLPDGSSIVIPRYSDVFGPGVDQATVLRFSTCEPGMPTAGGEYVFTGLDGIGEPIPGAIDTDIWVGVEPPNPPTNVRAEVTEGGILVSWDESQTIPGSFEPTTVPQLGCYQLHVHSVETEESVYGAGDISVSPHLVPQDKADFTRKDYGLSLSEMEDGTYCLSACVHSIAPQGSLGKGLEYMASDYNQSIIFTIEDGEITIE